MKLFSALLARRNAKEPVPFQEILPLKLKPRVSGKGDRSSDVCCIQEMFVMLSCFKNNDFNQSLCPKEMEAFKNCYSDHINTKGTRKAKEAKGILIPGEKNLSYKQINVLLKQFPNIK